MPIHYFEGQTQQHRDEEYRKFRHLVPEFHNTDSNFEILKAYLAEKDLPFLCDTLSAAFVICRSKLAVKPVKFRTDDINAPGRTGQMTTAEKQEEERKITQAHEDRKAAINRVARQRERREAETRINQYQEYTNGKVNHAKTQTARQRMLAELDKSNPREV